MKKKEVIIDLDSDFDDLVMLIWLCTREDIVIKMVSYVGCGWTRHPYGLHNVLDLLAYLNCSHIPVADGARLSMSPEYSLPESLIELANQLWSIQLPKAKQKAIRQMAPDAIRSQCLSSQQPITIIATGPLTNIAMAYIQDPSIKDKIEAIFITGGAPPGRHSKDGFAGNERLDLYATRIVYQSGIKIVALPSTIAKQFPIESKLFNHLHEDVSSKQQQLIVDIFNQARLQQTKQHASSTLMLWDILTSYVFLYPEKCQYKSTKVKIDEHMETPQNAIQQDKNGYEICYVNDIPKNHVYHIILDDLKRHYG